MKCDMEKLEKILGNRFPSNMVADAGYGSEEKSMNTLKQGELAAASLQHLSQRGKPEVEERSAENTELATIQRRR